MEKVIMMVNNAGDVFITIKLNTLTDVPYKMTVGGAFVYVCERDRVKDFVYMTQSVITRFSRGPRRPRYNGDAV